MSSVQAIQRQEPMKRHRGWSLPPLTNARELQQLQNLLSMLLDKAEFVENEIKRRTA